MDLDIEMGDSADMALAFETDTAPFDYDVSQSISLSTPFNQSINQSIA